MNNEKAKSVFYFQRGRGGESGMALLSLDFVSLFHVPDM